MPRSSYLKLLSWPRPQSWPWLALLFLVLIGYLVTTEIFSQDCQDYQCYNATPSPESSDTPQQIIDKLFLTLTVNHSSVEWRKALLIGLVSSFIILVVFSAKFNLKNYVLMTLIIFLVAYFAATWTNWSRWRQQDSYIEKHLLSIRSYLNE